MSHNSMTAEDLLSQIAALPLTERHRFFTLLGSRLLQDDNFTHEQIFGHSWQGRPQPPKFALCDYSHSKPFPAHQ